MSQSLLLEVAVNRYSLMPKVLKLHFCLIEHLFFLHRLPAQEIPPLNCQKEEAQGSC